MDVGLYPSPGPKRGEAMKWIVWSNVTLAEAIGRLMAATHGNKPGETACSELQCLAVCLIIFRHRSALASDGVQAA